MRPVPGNASHGLGIPFLFRASVFQCCFMGEPYNIALIGCGTVGSGVARLLLEQPERLAARAGRPLVLRRVVVKEADKTRPVSIPRNLLTTNLGAVLNDPSIHCAVEVVGGIDWARRSVLDLLASGKDV